MVKYTRAEIVLREIPDKITLAFNISNCQHNCRNCHSPYLREDIGTVLDSSSIDKEITRHSDINCVVFMGEGKSRDELIILSKYIHEKYPNLLTGIYSGSIELPDEFYNEFDYVKVGPYIEEQGPLDKETTNQRLYKMENGVRNDITKKFWEKWWT